MNDNVLHFTNTPIFDQLKRERGYNPKFPPNVVSPFTLDLPKPAQEAAAVRGYMAPGAWMMKPVPKIDTPEPVKLIVNFHPLDLVNDYPDEATFVRERVEEFGRKHPDAVNVTMSTKEELDGTITLSITGYEQPGIETTEKPIFSELKAEPIRDKLADNQLALYRALAANQKAIKNDLDESIERMDRAMTEQTDESVNAASTTDVPHTQYAAPRPLWFSDEDNADEE
jgi:hypothetical protein